MAVAAAGPAASYRLDIASPPVPTRLAPLRKAAMEWASAQRNEFLQALPDPQLGLHGAPWSLQLRYDPLLHTAGFNSLIARGSSWTGGAHPLPILQTLNYDQRSRHLLSVADLFSQPAQATQAICLEARRQLLARLQGSPGNPPLASDPATIEQGTTNGPHTLDRFVLIGPASGPVRSLRILFATYEVAPYFVGPQQVDIDPRVFARWLKPQYRARFQAPPP